MTLLNASPVKPQVRPVAILCRYGRYGVELRESFLVNKFFQAANSCWCVLGRWRKGRRGVRCTLTRCGLLLLVHWIMSSPASVGAFMRRWTFQDPKGSSGSLSVQERWWFRWKLRGQQLMENEKSAISPRYPITILIMNCSNLNTQREWSYMLIDWCLYFFFSSGDLRCTEKATCPYTMKARNTVMM